MDAFVLMRHFHFRPFKINLPKHLQDASNNVLLLVIRPEIVILYISFFDNFLKLYKLYNLNSKAIFQI